jgi:hypothetical protein
MAEALLDRQAVVVYNRLVNKLNTLQGSLRGRVSLTWFA